MKDRLLALLAGDEEKERFLREAVRSREELPENDHFYAQLLELFVRLTVDEEEAKHHWERILDNYVFLKDRLERDVGIRVAILDYFLNLNQKLQDPFLVELHLFRETEKYAMVDSLTGLFNRRYFDLAIRKEIKRAARYDKDFALLMIDIDNFKKINDTKGHPFGDEVLRNLSLLLKKICREEDVVCRYGGEEFVIMLPEANSDGGIIFSNRLRQSMQRDPFFREHAITVSGGVASYPYAGIGVEDLVEQADQALYEAKFSGKDRFEKAYPKNKRRRPRFEIALPLRCWPLEGAQHETALRETCTRNVSLGGLGIELEESYGVGERLLFDIETPAGKATIVGKVAWRQQKTEQLFAYGIEFCDLKAEHRQIMMRILPSDFLTPAPATGKGDREPPAGG